MNSIKQKFDLTGKVAIVTGSSKGIGLSIARGLAENGAKLVISSRKQEAVDAVAAEFNKAGYDAVGIACHIGDSAQRETLVAKTIEKYGRIDILVNNAAINPFYGPLETSGEEVFDKIMNVNVKAPWLLSNLVQPYMKENGSGSIINISSVEGIHPGFRLGLYSMTKSALIMLTKNQAKEWGRFGIRSNVVCPGLIKTKFSQSLWSNDKLVEGYNQTVPLKRMAEPDEMAGVVMLLASDAGSYMTGGVYAADGGYLISG
ncbi:NAD(P)-dependent dehydrogenase (short-subunit alcohol dehydrogenase family) [Maribacter caenipelagi]|uniref:NAD(P)-dependent dehydrogenase (Short-subunit alcohol dehydrogenase family) n=1 Tax=Maribacter caenipelagi TaxID=1447781 RepID=A0A4R7D3T6_9FLAO|nr:glucose 1-dehydrogenase [Maribacter caenipelagi]TDS14295.1 NAD(P)-dependent dehydrogenase (short-subunit alcohol dehydrogenase family) [Maribacter caenipelagi]